MDTIEKARLEERKDCIRALLGLHRKARILAMDQVAYHIWTGAVLLAMSYGGPGREELSEMVKE